MNTSINTEFPDAKDAKDSQKTRKNSPNFDDDFSHEIIGAIIEVQRVLGVGLLESAYAAALAIEFKERELFFEREVAIRSNYKGHDLGTAYRADFIVEDSVIVEIKATDAIVEAHRAQLLSYLRLADLKLGILANFHTFPVAKGIHRMVNKL
jgi:GxxExxY protein